MDLESFRIQESGKKLNDPFCPSSAEMRNKEENPGWS
jgi:hypothetical protein